MKTYIDSFLELLYPEKNTCFICEEYDEEISDRYICMHCEKMLKKIQPPQCTKCSKPIDYISATICQECSEEEKYFEMSRSFYAYDGLIKKAIYSYKYYNQPYFYKLFGRMLVDNMINLNYTSFDFVTSVPLHSSKMRKRGYNQSELLARYISKELNIPYIDILKRTKKTVKQSEQTKAQRRNNLKNAFAIKKSPTNIIFRNILLVDDIYTTGATVNECSRILINYKVSKVYVVTIAR